MGEAAPAEAAQGKGISEHELDALRFGWGEACRIGNCKEHGWRARRPRRRYQG